MEKEARVTDAKRESVESLKKEFSDYNGYIFVDYRGLSVEQITSLRGELRKLGSSLRVVKNNFAKIAMRDFSSELDEVFVGPTAVCYVKGDKANEVSKVLFKCAKDSGKLSVKSGFVDKEIYDAAKLEMLSKLPTKLELVATLMATMKAPVQKLAATLLAVKESKEKAS